jgi:hypothetical protein
MEQEGVRCHSSFLDVSSERGRCRLQVNSQISELIFCFLKKYAVARDVSILLEYCLACCWSSSVIVIVYVSQFYTSVLLFFCLLLLSRHAVLFLFSLSLCDWRRADGNVYLINV